MYIFKKYLKYILKKKELENYVKGQGHVSLTFVTFIHVNMVKLTLHLKYPASHIYYQSLARTMIKANFQEKQNLQPDYPLTDKK